MRERAPFYLPKTRLGSVDDDQHFPERNLRKRKFEKVPGDFREVRRSKEREREGGRERERDLRAEEGVGGGEVENEKGRNWRRRLCFQFQTHFYFYFLLFFSVLFFIFIYLYLFLFLLLSVLRTEWWDPERKERKQKANIRVKKVVSI